jgi:hypothetical protein
MISSLLDDGTPSASAGSEFVLFDTPYVHLSST